MRTRPLLQAWEGAIRMRPLLQAWEGAMRMRPLLQTWEGAMRFPGGLAFYKHLHLHVGPKSGASYSLQCLLTNTAA